MLTMKEHILTLAEPYRSAALKSITILCEPRLKTKFNTLHSALAWALPAGELKRNPFWAGALNSSIKAVVKATPRRKVIQGKTYAKITTSNNWSPNPGDSVEASTDGSLWAKRIFISKNPTKTGGKYVVMNNNAELQFCQLIRKQRSNPFNKHG